MLSATYAHIGPEVADPTKRYADNRARGTQLGRPAEIAGDASKVKAIRAARASGKSFREVAREFGVGVGTVQRLTA